MKTIPFPALVAALSAVATLSHSIAAAGTLFLTAWLGVIIHADYTLRFRRVPLPRRPRRETSAHFRRFATATATTKETHRLAA